MKSNGSKKAYFISYLKKWIKFLQVYTFSDKHKQVF